MKLDIKLPMIYHASLNKDDDFPHRIIAAGEHNGILFYICSIFFYGGMTNGNQR